MSHASFFVITLPFLSHLSLSPSFAPLSRSQRREVTVKRLLEKIQPESIMLDASRIGTVDRQPMEVVQIYDFSEKCVCVCVYVCVCEYVCVCVCM